MAAVNLSLLIGLAGAAVLIIAAVVAAADIAAIRSRLKGPAALCGPLLAAVFGAGLIVLAVMP